MKFLLLIHILTIASQLNLTNSLKCRERTFRRKEECSLSKINIFSMTDEILFESKPKNTTRVLKIKNEVVKFLPKNFMENFKGILILHVTNSQLQSIDKKTFQYIKDLEEINFEMNELTELQVDTFSDLTHLKDLKLSFNQISSLNSKIFASNTALETLSLDSNVLEKVHENTFKNLEKLKHISLANNKIVELRDETFKRNHQLTHINLSNNTLVYIGPVTFVIPDGKLNHLALNGNKCIKNYEKFTDSKTKSLNFDAISEEIVENCMPFPLKEATEKLEKCNERVQETMKETANELKNADAEYEKKLNECKDKLNSELFSLKTILNDTKQDLAFEKDKSSQAQRKLSEIQNSTELCKETNDENIQKKNIAMNKLIECEMEKQTVSTESPENCEELETIKNEIKELKEKYLGFDFSCETQTFDSCSAVGLATPYDSMKLKNVDLKAAETTISLNISSSFIIYLPSNIFEVFQALKNVEISNSNVRFITKKTFESAVNVEKLNLNSNLISIIPGETFKGMKNLQILNIKSSNIKSLEPSAFDGLKMLEILNLRENLIEEIPQNLFTDLVALKTLNLAVNKIEHLNGDVLKTNENLEIVIFNHNPLKTIGQDLFYRCHQIKRIYYGNMECIKESGQTTSRDEFKTAVMRRCSV